MMQIRMLRSAGVMAGIHVAGPPGLSRLWGGERPQNKQHAYVID
jgi:hypothetical protein